MSASSSTTSTRGRPDMDPMVGRVRLSSVEIPLDMASRRRKRRRSRGFWPPVELPELEQRHWDIIGLALVAFAAFFACVFYLGWAGGEVGEALAGAILFTFGGVGYLAPVLMFAAGAVIVVRPMIPALHPLKTGVACLTSALM